MQTSPVLRLTAPGKTTEELRLIKGDRSDQAIASLIKDAGLLFSDAQYIFEVPFNHYLCKEDANSIGLELRLNGETISCSKEIFADKVVLRPEILRPFNNAFGLVKLELYVRATDTSWYSDYLLVMVRDTPQARRLQKMAQYVASHYEDLLCENSQGNPFLNKGLQTILSLVEKIVHAYESRVYFFNSHAHTRLITVPRKDTFEKLQAFNGQTMQHILQHPEELTVVNYQTGIQYRGKNYVPKHTLISDTVTTKDTYENRVILNFLLYLSENITSLLDQIRRINIDVPKSVNIDGYIPSTDTLFGEMRVQIKRAIERIELSRKRLVALLPTYRQILPIAVDAIKSLPKPTAIFQRIPTYRLFYDLIRQWFKFDKESMTNEEFFLTFLVNSQLYEYYVLLRILNHHKDEGYTLTETSNFDYRVTFRGKSVSETNLANTFVLTKDDSKLTIYYQPVIFGRGHIGANGIGLQRISSLSFDGTMASFPYYTPDYVCKKVANNGDSYEIGDAKYCDVFTLQRKHGPDLAYKYLFNVRPIDHKDVIAGLSILYGVGEEHIEGNFLDLIQQSNNLSPFFKYKAVL